MGIRVMKMKVKRGERTEGSTAHISVELIQSSLIAWV
jgi:hypothetical protein